MIGPELHDKLRAEWTKLQILKEIRHRLEMLSLHKKMNGFLRKQKILN